MARTSVFFVLLTALLITVSAFDLADLVQKVTSVVRKALEATPPPRAGVLTTVKRTPPPTGAVKKSELTPPPGGGEEKAD